MPPESPKRAGTQCPGSGRHPRTSPGGCLGWLRIPPDPGGSHGHGWNPPWGTGMSRRWRPPAAQPPASHPGLRGGGGESPCGAVSPRGERPPGPRVPSQAPAGCSKAFCHRVPLWQSGEGGRAAPPSCVSGTWVTHGGRGCLLPWMPSPVDACSPPRTRLSPAETAARAPQMLM